MVSYFVAFLLSLMVGAVLTMIVRNRAHRYGLLDQAKTSRKIHATPIPRLGGIAIVVGTFAPLTALLFYDSGAGRGFLKEHNLVVGLFAGGIAIALLGLYDDLSGANAKVKFFFQFAIAAALYTIGFRIDVIANPFGPPLALGVLSLPFTMMWIVGVVNAMNLIDGLDGLAGGVAFFGVATNFVLAASRGDVVMCLVMAALGGSILGFLIFNFNPASIFMGDTGSMFLGFVLAATSIKVNAKAGTAVAMLVPIISLGLPIMDTLLAMGRRVLVGRPMFSADKEHIHHRMMSRLSISHRTAVLVLYGICCLFAMTALGLSYANSAQTAMLLAAISVVVLVLMRKLGYLSPSQTGAATQARRRNTHLRSLVKEIAADLFAADSFQGLWSAVRPLAEALNAHHLELQLTTEHEGARDGAVFQTDRSTGTSFPVEVQVEIKVRDEAFGVLKISWRDGRAEVKRDEELALELVADALATHVARLYLLQTADPRRVVSLRK